MKFINFNFDDAYLYRDENHYVREKTYYFIVRWYYNSFSYFDRLFFLNKKSYYLSFHYWILIIVFKMIDVFSITQIIYNIKIYNYYTTKYLKKS